MTDFSADELFLHADAMHRLARDLVADAALADDAVQQAYVTALTRPPRDRVAIGGWLRAVVRSCSLDLLRSEGRRRRRERQVAREVSIAPDQTAERLELQEAIVAAVRGLGEPYSTAVWLRYFEGLEPAEIGARQGEPVKTIKTRLARALQQLRTKLDGRPGGREGWLAAIVPFTQVPLANAFGKAAVGGAGGLLSAKLLAMAAAAFFFGAGAWWWQREPVPAAGETVAASLPRSSPRDDARVAKAPVAVPAGVSGASPTQREAVAPLPTATGPSVQVRVVAADGQVVPSVEVLYAIAGQPSAAATGLDERERRLLQWDSVGWLGRFGERATTDAFGIARWPWRAQEGQYHLWSCVLQHRDQYAELWVSMAAQPDEVHELRLQPDLDFLVQVLDAQRSPVSDVPVTATFALRTEPVHTSRQDFGPTDADGRVLARHVQTWRDRIAPRGEALPATLRLDLPGIEVSWEIDARVLPTEPVILFLPPRGAFEITVRDALGAPDPDVRLNLREDVPDNERSHTATSDAFGIARFPWVGLGRSWRLDREMVESEQMQRVVGPLAAGEVVRVLRQPDPVPVLTGRLLRAGAPEANTSLAVTSPRGTITRNSVATDADGRFRIAATPSWRDQHLTELLVYPYSTANGHDGTRAVWRGDLVLSVGAHDLGTLVLEPLPVVAAGQLVLPAGEALPKDLRIGVEAATGDVAEPWRWVPLQTHHEKDGQFSLFGTAPNAALRLVVTTENRFVPVPPLPFVAGTHDLRIELRRGGSVRMSVIADSQFAAFCQVPLLVAVDVPLALPGFGMFNPGIDPRMARDWSFVGDAPLETAHTWPAVAPGRYRLEIWSRGLHRPLHAVPDIVVVDGQRNEDPRLQHLVVPGLRTIELTLPQVGEAQRFGSNPGVGVIAVLDGDRPGELCWQVDNQRAFFATVEPLDVLVRLHGFRDRIMRGLVGNQTIELQPGIPVTLRTESYSVPAGHTLRLELEAVDDVLARGKPQLYSAAAGGSVPGYGCMAMAGEWLAGAVSLRLPAPGCYRVTAELQAGDGKATALAVDPAVLQIADGGGTFPLQLITAR